MAHYNETGLEIFEQCDGKLDYCILGVGTGGTVTGVGRRLKELDPNIKIIGVDRLRLSASLLRPGHC
jgi:cysteine synthase